MSIKTIREDAKNMAVAEILTHRFEFDRAINSARNSVGKIGHNTTVRRIGETGYVVEYHENVIAVFNGDKLQITDAGWNTTTTAGRLNQITTAHKLGWVSKEQTRLVFTAWDTGKRYTLDHHNGVIFDLSNRAVVDGIAITTKEHELTRFKLTLDSYLWHVLENCKYLGEFTDIVKANKKRIDGYKRQENVNFASLYHTITGRSPYPFS